METVILQLVDDIVAVFTKIGQWRKRLLIWNWKDGSLICVRRFVVREGRGLSETYNARTWMKITYRIRPGIFHS